MEGLKACVHMYVCINILLPYYIKVTNLKTILTYKQIKEKTVSSEWLKYDVACGVGSLPLPFLRDNHW